MSRAAIDRACARLCAAPNFGPLWLPFPGGPEWQWFLSPKPLPGLHSPGTVDGVVVDDAGTVDVVDAAVVDVVCGTVVVVVAAVVDVVCGTVVVVVAAVVVVVAAVVDVVAAVVVVVCPVTRMVARVSVGIAQTTAALIEPFSVTDVVSWNAFMVMLPDAGARALTVIVGVVNVPGTKGPGFPDVYLSGAGNEAVWTIVCVAPPAVGARVAVPGFTIDPATNVAPTIWNVSERFEYDVIVSPLDELGSNADPPGNVTVNVELGAT
jgi:hypothetical protein